MYAKKAFIKINFMYMITNIGKMIFFLKKRLLYTNLFLSQWIKKKVRNFSYFIEIKYYLKRNY